MASPATAQLEVESPDSPVGTHSAAPDHQPHLKFYFVSSEQQFDAAKMGMWIFLVTEILLFSGMFVAYAVYRFSYPEVFQAAAHVLDPLLGFGNTLVLLGSSVTVALGINAIQRGQRRKMSWYLVATVLLAGFFLLVKYFEYTAKFDHGIFPGTAFDPHGPEKYAALAIPYAQQFFSIYFVATGIHAIHIIAGMGVLGWLAWRGFKGDFSADYYTPVECTGLYWHIVDIIWIFLFPLLYLIH
jgi:cytochrome c oxidase subunit 3